MELFNLMAGIKIQHIPYRGVSQSVTDILGGNISGMMLNLLTAKPHVEAGQLRMLGVTSPKRIERDAGGPDHRRGRRPGLRGAAMVRADGARRHAAARSSTGCKS